MPASSSIGQAISLTKQILAGFDPIFIQRVLNIVSNNLNITSSLNSHQIKNAYIDVVVMPMDAQVQEAVQKIKQAYPGILKRVTKIIVHPGTDTHLGHVESGPDKDPTEIHLFKGSIDQEVKKMFGTTTPTSEEYKEALVRALVEVIGHEAGHIGEIDKTPEQMISNPFFDEGEAEIKSKEVLNRVYRADDMEDPTKYLKMCRGRNVGKVMSILFDLVGKKPFDGVDSERIIVR